MEEKWQGIREESRRQSEINLSYEELTRKLKEAEERVMKVEEKAKEEIAKAEEKVVKAEEKAVKAEEKAKEEIAKAQYATSLLRMVKEGLPPIELNLTTSGTSGSVNKERLIATVEMKRFSLLENLDLKSEKVVAMAQETKSLIYCNLNERNTKLFFSNESEVQFYVKLVLQDLLYLNGLGEYMVIPEVQSNTSNRCDIWVIKDKVGRPVLVLEVKKPSKVRSESQGREVDIVDHECVHGQLFDYMWDARHYHGLKEVFGIVCTYNQWKLFWFKDCDSVASSSSADYESIEPSSSTERCLSTFKTYNWNDPEFVPFMSSVLIKASKAKHMELDLLSATRRYLVLGVGKSFLRKCLQIARTKFQWCVEYPSFDLSEMKNEEFVMLRKLGAGRDGVAILACVFRECKAHAVVVKFTPKADKEARIWKQFCNMDVPVCALGVSNVNCVILPYVGLVNVSVELDNVFNITVTPGQERVISFHDIPNFAIRNLCATYKSTRQIASEAISNWKRAIVDGRLKSIHDDVSWKHIGLLPVFEGSSVFKGFLPVLIDFAGVQESDSCEADLDKAQEIMESQLTADEGSIIFKK